MTNETQGARIILDPFLEHPKLGLLLAECQCPQSDFRTGHFEMEYHNPPKKSKRQSTLTLNKKGSRYYSHAIAEQSQTTSAASAENFFLEMHHSLEATDLVEVTHPVDLSTNIFASQSEHSENFAALPHAPATTKYKKTFKQP